MNKWEVNEVDPTNLQRGLFHQPHTNLVWDVLNRKIVCINLFPFVLYIYYLFIYKRIKKSRRFKFLSFCNNNKRGRFKFLSFCIMLLKPEVILLIYCPVKLNVKQSIFDIIFVSEGVSLLCMYGA